MRKILYSPGFGSGWTTWGGATPEQKRFMLEYQPFVEYLETGGNAAALEPAYGIKEDAMHPLVRRFLSDWRSSFPGADTPYLGGLRDLEVQTVPDGVKVRIEEYNGSESVEVEGDFDGWL